MRFDDRYLRPTEVDALIGTRARLRELDCQATVACADLARLMVDADIAALESRAGWVDRPALVDWPVHRLVR